MCRSMRFKTGAMVLAAMTWPAAQTLAAAQGALPPSAHEHEQAQGSHEAASAPLPDSGASSHSHDEMQMPMEHEQDSMTRSREGSGTSWLPDATPMYPAHAMVRGWMLMAHGNGFLQYLRETGDRGSHQFGSVNWLMGMADRGAACGHFGARLMMSLEPWTVRGCGYPDLLASGEECRGAAIHDRQHPHDLVMELAATYDRWSGGCAGRCTVGR
jgi:hypothetical protein